MRFVRVAMSVIGAQIALLGATLIGPAAWMPAGPVDCSVARAPGNLQRLEVAPGDRLAKLLRDVGVKATEVAHLTRAFGRRPNLAALSIGDRIDVAATTAGEVMWFRYRREQARAACASRTLRGTFRTRRSELLPEVKLARVAVTVERTLAEAFRAAGESASLDPITRELFPDRAFSPQPDQPAAQVTLLVERRSIEGELLDYGRVFAAELRRGEDVQRAFHFVGKSGGGYYTATGEPRLGTRLRSPVPGGVMTSPFGLRRHPIKRRRRMHKGLDFGAAHGTPVLAAADGVVAFARWKGHLGKTVRLRHEGGLVTHYAHLSSFAQKLRSGRRVRQGQTIGYVGSTGLSSGAHLHFETIVDRRHVDPGHLLAAPAPAIAEADLEGFAEHIDELLGLLQPGAVAPDGA